MYFHKNENIPEYFVQEKIFITHFYINVILYIMHKLLRFKKKCILQLRTTGIPHCCNIDILWGSKFEIYSHL